MLVDERRPYGVGGSHLEHPLCENRPIHVCREDEREGRLHADAAEHFEQSLQVIGGRLRCGRGLLGK